MKSLLLLLFFSVPVWSKPLVMISYFDAFNRASFNNSERVAKAVAAHFTSSNSEIEIKLCALNTIFDKAFSQTEECLKALPETPIMVIGLGESTCQLKVETIMRNLDKTIGPDNAGNRRTNTRIIPEAADYLGLRYPLHKMYCSLSSSERRDIDLSNNAGSFVCNNTAFQMSYYYPEIQYGFIHVPANTCNNLINRTNEAVNLLTKMIKGGVEFLNSGEAVEGLPHSSNDLRLPISNQELKSLKKMHSRSDDCLKEYIKKSKGTEERRTFIFGLMN